MIQETRIAVGVNTLNVAVAGNGPPLVLFHGVTRRWQSFLPILPWFTSRWRVHVVDQRGHGGSGRAPASGEPADGYRVIDYAAEAAEWLRSCFDEPVVVYGHSLGAMVAASVAMDVPGLVRATILEDPPFHTMGDRIRESSWYGFFAGLRRIHGDGETVAETTSALARMPVGLDEPVLLGDVRDRASLRFTARTLIGLDPRVLDAIVDGRWLEGYDVDRLASLAQPTLLLQADGAAGGMLRDDDVRRLVGNATDVSHVHLSHRGHLLHWQDTVEVANLVTNFLESL